MKTLLLIILSTILNATGDPYINIKLKPIATNEYGAVLFQTYSDINTYGSYSCSYDKFGWLVVSADGTWDERVAYETSEIFDNDCNLRDKKKYDAYKTGKISLKNPDKILAKLQAKYYFNRSIAKSNEKYKVLELKPKQSCFSGKCINKVLPQKSVEGFVSTIFSPSKNAQSLRSSFYHKGVALMRTPMYVNEETVKYDKQKNDNPKSYEQNFNLPKLVKGRSYGATFIDSVVFVEPFEFRQPTQEVKSEVEKVVRDLSSLLIEKKFDLLDKKYLHPKYGVYSLYAMAANAEVYNYKSFQEVSVRRRSQYEPIYFDALKKVPQKIEWEKVIVLDDDCDWSSKGVFIHDEMYMPLSEWLNESKYDYDTEANYRKEKADIAKFLDKDVFVVVMTEEDIIFHLKKIDGKWYIVLFDRLYTNRDA